MPDPAPQFTLPQALAAQRALRTTLGLGEEIFPLPAFVGMISDEVEQLRAAGHTDADIARIVHTACGIAINPADLTTHYVPPDQRHG